jgi:ATP-dependent DNA ligase
LKLRQEQFVIDSELLVLDKDGVSDFSALLSGRHNEGARSTLSTCLLVTARITVA